MDNRLAALVGLAFLLATLATSCDLNLYTYEVRNRTPFAVGVAVSDCTEALPQNLAWTNLSPGATQKGVTVRFRGDSYGCPLVAAAGGRIIFRDTVGRGGIYEVRGGTTPNVVRTGEADRYDFRLTLWLLVAYLVMFLAGLPFALFFTVQFFYRYYVSKTIRPSPVESGNAGPPAAPPPPAPVTAEV